MKKIIEKVREKIPVVSGSAEAGMENREKAVAAIIGGIRSPAWEAYMTQFVEKNEEGEPLDPRQLMRLLATDDTLGDRDLDVKRAYLVGNGVCAQGTGTNLDQEVNTIDRGIPGGCSPS